MLLLAVTQVGGGVGEPPAWGAKKVCLRGKREVVLQTMTMLCSERILRTVIKVRLF